MARTSTLHTRRARFSAELARARGFARRMPPLDATAPEPPPLPEGTVVPVPGRGEMFVRHLDGPQAGAPSGAHPEVPVLLLHGWTWTADINWWPVYEPAGQHRRVLGVDHRGHGRSLRAEATFTLEDAADDLAALLDVLGIPQVIACGYSMGGPISLLLAERHPEKVAGIVLCATTLEWTKTGPASERYVLKALPLLGALMRIGSWDRGIAKFLRVSSEMAPVLAPYRAWVAGEWRRQSPTDILQAGRALNAYDFRSRVGAVSAKPSAVVLTQHDRLVNPERQRAMAGALGSRVFPIDADHDCNLVAPKAFADAAVEAIEDVAVRIGVVGAA